MNNQLEIEWVKENGITADYKFVDDETIYQQVENRPRKDKTIIALVVKGTEINIATDKRFWITIHH